MDELLEIEVDADDPSVVVRLRGELDMASAPALGEVFDRLDASQPVVVDLERVGFVDVAGVRPILVLGRRVPVRLRRPHPMVRLLVGVVGEGQGAEVEFDDG